MSTLSGIYDSGPIQPIAKIKENLSVWTLARWFHYIIEYIEPLPPSPASTVEMVAAAATTTLAANGTITKRVVTILQVNNFEFLHLRFEPLDNVECVLWEQAGSAKFTSRNLQARVDRNTRLLDPYLATTTFWILGENRDMNLELRNPMQYAMPIARVLFWGFRYILKPWPIEGVSANEKNLLQQGDLETVRKIIGATTWVPAEGRGA